MNCIENEEERVVLLVDVDPRVGKEGRLAEVRVHSVTWAAEGVLLFDLRPPGGEGLSAFTPGAHIDVDMPGGLRRSYSLLNNCAERHRYVIGVQKDGRSRGGSKWMHEGVRPGTMLAIGRPRNHFPLFESAPHSVLIAGGIGVTPIWSMIQRLQVLGRSWTLHYSARTRSSAALLESIEQVAGAGRVELNFDDTSGQHLDIAGIVRSAPTGAHFYCCGPAPMLQAFEDACEQVDRERVHLERFGAAEPRAAAGGFAVTLARQGKTIAVEPGRTILEALRVAGISVPFSCQQGICGVCEAIVLQGVPDHRDLVLTQAERASNGTMMICCSGSRTAELILDL